MQRINLIPEEIVLKPTIQFKSRVLLSKLLFLPLLVAFFCAVDAFPQFATIRNLQDRLKTAEEKCIAAVKRLEDTVAGESHLQGQIEEWEQKTVLLKEEKSSLEQELKAVIKWSDVLIELSRITSENTWLDKILLDKDILTIEGFTLSNLKVSEFLKSLENSPLFNEVEFRSTERKKLEEREEDIIEFRIIGKLH
ncbi:MAG: PilN domain-containing protein [Candidatus Omnitrophota bacterium]|nr:PilN domain-containing protein [Candidatus Omnitrophota bacterium]